MQADCITLCVIDDCCDSDVPLLEVSLSELHVQQVRTREEVRGLSEDTRGNERTE